jgi:hypothetical protein
MLDGLFEGTPDGVFTFLSRPMRSSVGVRIGAKAGDFVGLTKGDAVGMSTSVSISGGATECESCVSYEISDAKPVGKSVASVVGEADGV